MANDPLHEMLSAVIDGEASEFEYRKVIEGLRKPELRSHMARHYALGSILRGEAERVCPATVTERIFAAIENEPALSQMKAPRWRQPLLGMAIAASVCAVAVIGTRWMMPGGALPSTSLPSAAEVARVNKPESQVLGELGQPAHRNTASSGVAAGVGFGAALPVAVGSPGGPEADANRDAEIRLRRYLLEHEGNATLNGNQGVLPYARVVNFE